MVCFTDVVLPIGLSLAPYVFTKMMRPLVKLWCRKGLKVVVYLDDGICALRSYQCFRTSVQIYDTSIVLFIGDQGFMAGIFSCNKQSKGGVVTLGRMSSGL